jgi:hypothetical protein
MATLHRISAHDVWKRRVAQRAIRMGTVAALVVVMLGTMNAVAVSAGPTMCANTQIQPQCIADVKVTPHGMFADISFFTTSAKIATVDVSLVAPKKQPDGTLSYTGLPTDGFAISPAVNQHVVQILNLSPHLTYHFLINAAKGQIGSDAQFTGTFMTLSRHVDVTFTSIHVTDDSDSLGAGELTFFFFVNGWLKDFPSGDLTYPLQSASIDVGSGDTISLPGLYRHVQDNAPDTLTLKVFGKDDDCEGVVPLPGYPVTLCSAGAGPYENPPDGSNSDADWATATAQINVTFSGPNETYQKTLVLTTSSDRLKFEASVSILITFS